MSARIVCPPHGCGEVISRDPTVVDLAASTMRLTLYDTSRVRELASAEVMREAIVLCSTPVENCIDGGWEQRHRRAIELLRDGTPASLATVVAMAQAAGDLACSERRTAEAACRQLAVEAAWVLGGGAAMWRGVLWPRRKSRYVAASVRERPSGMREYVSGYRCLVVGCENEAKGYRPHGDLLPLCRTHRDILATGVEVFEAAYSLRLVREDERSAPVVDSVSAAVRVLSGRARRRGVVE